MTRIHLVTALRGTQNVSNASDAPAAMNAEDADSSLLEVINAAGLPLGQSCRGLGICHSCGVWVGGAPCTLALLEPAPERERAAALEPGWRLACQCDIPEPVRVAVPDAHTLLVWHPSWGAPQPAIERLPRMTAPGFTDRLER